MRPHRPDGGFVEPGHRIQRFRTHFRLMDRSRITLEMFEQFTVFGKRLDIDDQRTVPDLVKIFRTLDHDPVCTGVPLTKTSHGEEGGRVKGLMDITNDVEQPADSERPFLRKCAISPQEVVEACDRLDDVQCFLVVHIRIPRRFGTAFE